MQHQMQPYDFASPYSGNMFAPRGETQFVDFRSREEMNTRRTDVKHKPLMQPVYRTTREVECRKVVMPSERHKGIQRPEFTSLADVYEGALRNVLGIQLHLALDDQQSFTQEAINDLLIRDKTATTQQRAPLRQETLKRRGKNQQQERSGEESKEPHSLGSFQGRTLLRDPRRDSPGGSAFHVPPKKARMDEEMSYSERGFPMDRYGVPPPRANYPPDYSSSFLSPRGSPGMFHRRVNAPEAVAHVYGTNGVHIPVPRDHYSLWSFGHHRDFSTLFPVRCSSIESERRFHIGVLEQERRRNLDLVQRNGFAQDKTAVRVKVEKEAREDEVQRDRKPRVTERRSSETSIKDLELERGKEREKLSPSSPLKLKLNSLLPSYRSSPVINNGSFDFRMETRYRSALRKMESRRDGKRRNGEDAKEEFLFKLGLERIEA